MFQQAWKQGATHQDLFGDSPFQLHGSVGPSGADNHRPDVAKVETFLGDAGYYKPMTADGPTGWHNTNLDTAIKTFQKDHGLKVDGLLKPNGPTIGKIDGVLGGQTAAEPSGPAEPTTPGLGQQGGDAPAQPLGIREGEWDWRDRGSRQPKADSEQVEGVDYIEIHGWNPHAPPIRIPIGRRGQGPFDPFANHTITEEGAAEHDRYAQALVKDSDPSKTAAFLKNITDWYGDKGKGDVADLLGRFQKVDPDKAQHLQSEVAKLTGTRIPFRVALAGGPMADPAAGESESVQLPKTNPWGSAEGADPFEVKGMVDALKGKGDYQDAAKHFAGEFKRDPDWARPYTAAVYEGLAKDNPQQAALFARQMAGAGLVTKPLQFAEAAADTRTDAASDTGQQLAQAGPNPGPGGMKPPEGAVGGSGTRDDPWYSASGTQMHWENGEMHMGPVGGSRTEIDVVPNARGGAGGDPNASQGPDWQRFDEIMRDIEENEGGYSDHASDPGGKTKYGITEETLNAYFKSRGGSAPDIRDLTKDQARQIYKEMYYDKHRIGDIRDKQTANHVFDLVVNPGPGGGGRLVQQAINEVTGAGIKVDGAIGEQTVDALNKATPAQLRELNKRVAELRIEYYRQRAKEDPKKEVFLPGWYRRANKYKGPWGEPAN